MTYFSWWKKIVKKSPIFCKYLKSSLTYTFSSWRTVWLWMEDTNAVSETMMFNLEWSGVASWWRNCSGWRRSRGVRWCWCSLGRLWFLEQERAESLSIWLGDEATLGSWGGQHCRVLQMQQLGRGAGGAEDLQLLTCLHRQSWETVQQSRHHIFQRVS